MVTQTSRLHNAERTSSEVGKTKQRERERDRDGETAIETVNNVNIEAMTTVAFSRSSSKKAKSCHATR